MDTFLGNSEFLLRLPNLLLFAVYLFYCYRLYKGKNPIVAVVAFALLSANIMVVDLFGLARGYGLSIGFGMMSLYYLIAFVKNENTKDLLVFHLTALLAALSNFTLIIVYVALIAVYTLVILIKHFLFEKNTVAIIRQFKLHLLPFLTVCLVLYEPVRRLLTESDLGFGGKSGFFKSTVRHHIMNTFNTETTPDYLVFFQILFTAAVLVPTLIIIKNLIRQQRAFLDQHMELIVSNFLLLTICGIIISQHFILGSDYPINRFSVFLFPIYMLQLGYFLNYLTTTPWKKPTLVISSALGVLSIIGFVSNANLYEYTEWEYESGTRKMISVLRQDVEDNQLHNIQLGIDWLFEPSINYYIVKDQLTWLSAVDRKGISPSDHYFYIEEKHLDQLSNIKYSVVKRFEQSNTILLRNTTIIH